MFHRNTSYYHRIIAVLIALIFGTGQPKALGQTTTTHNLDVFSGLDVNFRDINFKTQYEFLLHLTPGFKWDFGNHWQLSGQVHIPIVNQFGEDYKYVQLNVFDLSKEMRFHSLYLKATAGIFSHNRYGMDLKAFLPLCDWFAFEGQAGLVGSLYLYPYWKIVAPNHFVGTIGGDIYLPRWNTQFRGVVGKYIYDVFGFEVEAMRHFNHTTVSVYASWSDQYSYDAGFRVVIMIPPYHRTHRTVNIRPASNFRMSYMVLYKQYSNRMYKTDPEENERDGWFSRDLLQWGSHTMQPDFIITEKE